MYGESRTKSGVSLDISFFDPRTIKRNSIILVIGKRGSGKSTVARDIMSYHSDIKAGLCICKTNRMNGFWSPHIPARFIHEQYSQQLTYNLLEYQEKKWLRHKRKCIRHGKTAKLEDIKPIFAIYDDVTFDKSFLRDQATRELFMNGRHYNIMVVITCQWMMDMDPGLRNQVDYVFMLRDNKLTNKRRMHEYFAGAIDHYSVFNRVFMTCTENREAMVLFNNSTSNYIPDSIFFYRAKVDHIYRLGDDKYWDPAHTRRFSLLMINNKTKRDNECIGMSRHERERTASYRVEKHYPAGVKAPKTEDDEDDDASDDQQKPPPVQDIYAPKKRNHYIGMYRANTLPPASVVLGSGSAYDTKRNHIDTLPTPLLSVSRHTGERPRLPVTPRHMRVRPVVISDATASVPVKVIQPKAFMRVKELRTQEEEDFIPIEPYGEDIVREVRKEGIMKAAASMKSKRRALDRRKRYRWNQKQVRNDEKIQRRQRQKALENQLFLY